MPSSNSLALNLSKKFTFLKTIYLYYNLYIRNFKFFFNSSQFGEDKKIIKLFDINKKGTYLDVGCLRIFIWAGGKSVSIFKTLVYIPAI